MVTAVSAVMGQGNSALRRAVTPNVDLCHEYITVSICIWAYRMHFRCRPWAGMLGTLRVGIPMRRGKHAKSKRGMPLLSLSRVFW